MRKGCEKRRVSVEQAAARLTRSLRRLRTAVLYGKASFDPNQPRAPAGTADGGQWLRVAGTGAKDKCIEECYRLLERPQPSGTSLINTWAFHRCVSECLAAAG